jgi:dCMP deaminase
MKDANRLFGELALRFAKESHCLSKHVCCLAVKDNHIISTGINGTPSGTPNCDYIWQQTHRDCGIKMDFNEWITTDAFKKMHHEWQGDIHAEQNAVAYAAKVGISLKGCDFYCTLLPCEACAKLLVACEPRTVYYIEDYPSKHFSMSVFNACRIPLIYLNYEEPWHV